MIPFILSGGNVPFTIAVGLALALALLEIVTFLLGFALSNVVDSAVPDLDVDADVGGEPSATANVLHWLHFGSVPSFILLVIFLLAFGLAGWGSQSVAVSAGLGMLSPWWIAPIALIVGILAVRTLGGTFARVVPDVQTSAVSADSLVGGTATITLGTARAGEPSQAKLQDKFGQTHYVLVEPMNAGDEFPHGSHVTLIRREGPKYFVVEASVDALLALGSQDLSAERRLKA